MRGSEFNNLARKCAKLLREAGKKCPTTAEQLTILLATDLSQDEVQALLDLPAGRFNETGHEITNGFAIFQDVVAVHIEAQRGGARAGAGRKPADPDAGNKALVSVRVAPDVAELINAQPLGSRSSFVEAAVRAYASKG